MKEREGEKRVSEKSGNKESFKYGNKEKERLRERVIEIRKTYQDRKNE